MGVDRSNGIFVCRSAPLVKGAMACVYLQMNQLVHLCPLPAPPKLAP